jgi:outer membrane protein assembly factor BamA
LVEAVLNNQPLFATHMNMVITSMQAHFLRRFVTFFLVALLSFSGWAAESIAIKDIRVEGLQRVEPGTVFASCG